MDQEDNEGTLYRYTVEFDSLKDKTKICDDVSSFIVYGEDVVTRSNSYDDTIMGLYTGGKYYEVSDSAGYQFQYSRGTLYYLDDFSNKDGSGTLMKFRNGKSEKIDTDVFDIFVRSENDVVYIKDYNTKRNYGDLYHKRGNSEPTRIDTDVSNIIRIY